MPVVLPEFTRAWPDALGDFAWGVRRYAYPLITAALCCGLLGYLIARIRPQHAGAYAVVRVTDAAAGSGLQNLLGQDDFLARVAAPLHLDGHTLSDGQWAGRLPGVTDIRVEQSGDLVELSVIAPDADVAADVANAIVQGWLEVSASGKRVLVSAAQVHDPAVGEQPATEAVVAVAAALLLGAVIAGLNELLRGTFRMPGDIAARLPVLELGAIPDCRALKDRSQHEALIHTAFRSLLQSLWSTGRPGKRPRVVVVTSPRHGDGRSMVAANLALAFADTSRWVLLIDANAQTPSLHGALSVPNDWGLADALREDTAIDLYDFQRLFKRSATAGLWVMPVGNGPLDLSSRSMRDRLNDLIARARMEFHNVIVDTAPGSAPEVRMLAATADGVLLVVRASKTTQKSAVKLANQFTGDGIGVVGAVLNDWRPGMI